MIDYIKYVISVFPEEIIGILIMAIFVWSLICIELGIKWIIKKIKGSK